MGEFSQAHQICQRLTALGELKECMLSALHHTECARGEDGRFSIDLLPEAKPGSLHMEPGKPNCVIARHYWEKETCALADPECRCEIEIECLDEPGYVRPLGPVLDHEREA